MSRTKQHDHNTNSTLFTVSLLKTLRYLHLFIGAAALLAGLFASVPFLTPSAPISYPGLLAILTGLINLQQFAQQRTADRGMAGGVALVVASLVLRVDTGLAGVVLGAPSLQGTLCNEACLAVEVDTCDVGFQLGASQFVKN